MISTKLIIVVACLIGSVSLAEEKNDSAKWSKAVATAVSKGHPRLFATETDFKQLKKDLSKGVLRSMAAKRIVERAEFLLPTEPLARKLVGRRLLDTSRAALYRISTLAMAFRLSGDRRFLDRAVKELRAVCAFSDWNPSHFLDTGEMSLAVAEVTFNLKQ